MPTAKSACVRHMLMGFLAEILKKYVCMPKPPIALLVPVKTGFWFTFD